MAVQRACVVCADRSAVLARTARYTHSRTEPVVHRNAKKVAASGLCSHGAYSACLQGRFEPRWGHHRPYGYAAFADGAEPDYEGALR